MMKFIISTPPPPCETTYLKITNPRVFFESLFFFFLKCIHFNFIILLDVQCKQNKSFENNHFYTTILDLQNPKIDGGRPKRSRTDFGAVYEGNSCS